MEKILEDEKIEEIVEQKPEDVEKEKKPRIVIRRSIFSSARPKLAAIPEKPVDVEGKITVKVRNGKVMEKIQKTSKEESGEKEEEESADTSNEDKEKQ